MKKWDKLLWLGVLVGILAYFAYTVAHSAPAAKRPHAPRLKAPKFTPYPTQGAGALDLITTKAIVTPPEVWGVYYFTATCKDALGLESDYSNEVIFTNTSANNSNRVSLAWGPSPSTNVVGYYIHEGGAPRTYTNVFSAGTNLAATVTLQTELTNIVLSVTCTNGGTNIVIGITPRGPWTKLNTTNFVATNFPSPRFFRGIGKNGNRVLITQRHV